MARASAASFAFVGAFGRVVKDVTERKAALSAKSPAKVEEQARPTISPDLANRAGLADRLSGSYIQGRDQSSTRVIRYRLAAAYQAPGGRRSSVTIRGWITDDGAAARPLARGLFAALRVGVSCGLLFGRCRPQGDAPLASASAAEARGADKVGKSPDAYASEAPAGSPSAEASDMSEGASPCHCASLLVAPTFCAAGVAIAAAQNAAHTTPLIPAATAARPRSRP